MFSRETHGRFDRAAGILWFGALVLAISVVTSCVVGVGSSSESERVARTLPVSGALPGKLVVRLDRGSVEVRAHDASEVRIEAQAFGASAGRYRFEIEHDDEGVKLSGHDNLHFYLLPLPFPWRHPGDIQVRAWVPRPYSVLVRTAHGDADLAGLEGDVRITLSHGRIEVTSIDGDLNLRTHHGRLRVDSISGDLQIDATHAPVTASRIAGDVEIASAHGRVKVSEVEGKLRVRTSHSPVEIASANLIDVETSHAPIRLYDVVGPVYARNQHDSIDARFSSRPSGELRTRHSRIRIELPEGEGTDLDASASHGRVKIAREIEVDGLFERERIVAQLNGGGGELRVTANHRSIELRSR